MHSQHNDIVDLGVCLFILFIYFYLFFFLNFAYAIRLSAFLGLKSLTWLLCFHRDSSNRKCFRCLVFTQWHPNLLQYKESKYTAQN